MSDIEHEEIRFRTVDSLDKDEIKRRLPLAYVAERLGIHLQGGGTALCPFHPDTTPSFRLGQFEDGAQFWSCDPCGQRGRDHYDLIMRDQGVDFPSALALARQYLDEMPEAYQPPAISIGPSASPISRDTRCQRNCR